MKCEDEAYNLIRYTTIHIHTYIHVELVSTYVVYSSVIQYLLLCYEHNCKCTMDCDFLT
jgi:hypothetical protein